VNTSIVLGENIKDKTVVLIGAIIPYNEPESDALFNLGFAVSSVQLLPHGVYVCMQGVVFDWFNVRKNRDLMKFEVLNKEE
jgi:L-asparaginase